MKFQIVMVRENGMTKPHFCCIHCGKIIEDASLALVVWNPDLSNDAVIVCKSATCELSQAPCYSMELDVAWYFLGNNSGIDPKAVKQKAHDLATVGA
jgi:hypothetical protein